MIVDDERVIADTLSMIFSRSGFEVSTAYSGEEAVKLAGTVKPHVLISDVMMKGITGVQAAMKILDQRSDTRVFLFSGQAATCHFVKEAESRGFRFSVLAKPLHPTVLLKLVESSLAPAALTNDPAMAVASC